ncbi:MAG: polysaccharide deacetylase family protein [Clostridia bacterium]|nr:polysaccharide deacetylase family protein [Clostridia bacterium]
MLDRRNIKVTFFMVGDWVEKFPESVKKIMNAGHEIRESFHDSCTCCKIKL